MAPPELAVVLASWLLLELDGDVLPMIVPGVESAVRPPRCAASAAGGPTRPVLKWPQTASTAAHLSRSLVARSEAEQKRLASATLYWRSRPMRVAQAGDLPSE